MIDDLILDLNQLGVAGRPSSIAYRVRTYIPDWEGVSASPPFVQREVFLDDVGRIVREHWYDADESHGAIYRMTYDELGRLTRRVESYLRSGDFETSVLYDDRGRVVDTRLASEGRMLTRTAYDYDDLDRLLSATTTKFFEDGDSHIFSRARYEHDGAGAYRGTIWRYDHDGDLVETHERRWSAGGILLETRESRPDGSGGLAHDRRRYHNARGWVMRDESEGRALGVDYSWLIRYDYEVDDRGDWRVRHKYSVDRTLAGANPTLVETMEQEFDGPPVSVEAGDVS